jgi:hypothetical protein
LDEDLSLEKAGEAVKTIPIIRSQQVIAIGTFLFNIRFISTSLVKIVMVADIQTVAIIRSNCCATK